MVENLGNPFKTAKVILIKPYFEKRKSAQVIRILALYIHKENKFLTRISPKNMFGHFNHFSDLLIDLRHHAMYNLKKMFSKCSFK